VEKKDAAPFHENIMRITRKGMNNESYDPKLSMSERWNYSKQLANWLNTKDLETDEKLCELKSDSESYFSLLKRMRIEDKYVFWKKENPKGGRTKELLLLILLFPIMLIGAAHCLIPYKLSKGFAEKSFKRKVFWSSVKLIMGKISIGLINIPVIFLFYSFVYESWILAIAYYFLIGIYGGIAYVWFINLKTYKTKGAIQKADLSKFIKKRDDLESRIIKVIESQT
jgi:hypothetical protein